MFEKKIKKIFKGSAEQVMIIIDIILNVIIIVGVVYSIRTFIISPFQVYGPSMCDTLNYINDQCERGFGEYIIINKIGYSNLLGWQIGSPKRGDIIVFKPPQNQNEYFIKRVIGLPGETVKLKNGDVYISNQENSAGFQLEESYLSPSNQHNTHPYREENSVFEVPANEYFVLGDNRTQSSDSRSCFKESIASRDCGSPGITPFLNKNFIEGKAWLVLWPLQKIAALQDPHYAASE